MNESAPMNTLHSPPCKVKLYKSLTAFRLKQQIIDLAVDTSQDATVKLLCKVSYCTVTLPLLPIWSSCIKTQWTIFYIAGCRISRQATGFWFFTSPGERLSARLMSFSTSQQTSVEVRLLSRTVRHTRAVLWLSWFNGLLEYRITRYHSSILHRSGLVIPGTERELFRELSAPLPREPRITTEVLFQVGHPVI